MAEQAEKKKERIKEWISDLQDFYLLSFWGFLGLIRKPFYSKDMIEQMDYAGTGSFVIIHRKKYFKFSMF